MKIEVLANRTLVRMEGRALKQKADSSVCAK